MVACIIVLNVLALAVVARLGHRLFGTTHHRSQETAPAQSAASAELPVSDDPVGRDKPLRLGEPHRAAADEPVQSVL